MKGLPKVLRQEFSYNSQRGNPRSVVPIFINAFRSYILNSEYSVPDDSENIGSSKSNINSYSWIFSIPTISFNYSYIESSDPVMGKVEHKDIKGTVIYAEDTNPVAISEIEKILLTKCGFEKVE